MVFLTSLQFHESGNDNSDSIPYATTQVIKTDPGLGASKSEHKTLLLLRELPQTGEKALNRRVCTEAEAAKPKVTIIPYLCP